MAKKKHRNQVGINDLPSPKGESDIDKILETSRSDGPGLDIEGVHQTRGNISPDCSSLKRLESKVTALVATVTELNNFCSKFNTLSGLVKQLSETVQEFKDSMQFMNKEFEEVRKEICNIGRLNTQLSRDNVQFKSDIVQLKDQFSVVYNKLHNAECEIVGLPLDENCNPMEIAKKMVQKLGESVGVQPHEVSSVNVRVTGNKKILTMTLTSSSARDKLLDMARREKPKLAYFGINGENTPVYFNAPLCLHTRKLFALAKVVQRERHYRFVWIKHGQVFMKKDESSRARKLLSENDLLTA